MFTSTANMDLPRQIPGSLRFKILFLHPFMLAAVMPVIMGIIFSCVFGSMVDFKELKFNGSEPRVEGVVTDVQETNTRVNHHYLYAYYFTYTTKDNVQRNGVSYDYYTDTPTDTVEVEYLPNDPQEARIVGMSTSTMHPAVLLAGAIPLLIGLIFFFIAFSKGRKNLYLVRNGILTEGRVISKERTNTRINNRYVYRITFEFNANGAPVRAMTKTHKLERILDEAKERVVYDSNDPQKANFVDAMPNAVRKFFDGTM